MFVPVAAHALQLIAGLACGWFVLSGYRWIRRRSEALALVVAVAVLARAAAGLALFWVSYLGLPIARGLQVGNGFWQPALDATGYFQLASAAVAAGTLVPLDHSVPAPLYVDALALWMSAVGVSPAAGMFLNLCLYVMLAVLVVWCFEPLNDWRADLPCIIGLTAYSLSPVVLIHSTQPLKDEASNLLIALACMGVLALRRLLTGPPPLSRLRLAGAAAVLMLAAFGLAGIRWYFALIILGTLSIVLTAFGFAGRRIPIRPYLTASVIVLLAVSVGFVGGAGPYSRVLLSTKAEVEGTAPAMQSIAARATDLITLPFFWVQRTATARTGFLMSGGNTNVIAPIRAEAEQPPLVTAPPERRDDGSARGDVTAQASNTERAAERPATAATATPAVIRASVPPPAASSDDPGAAARPPAAPAPAAAPSAQAVAQAEAVRAVPRTLAEHVKAVVVGLGILFVPLTLLEAVSGIRVAGGQGLLLVADFDTLFLDATVLAVLVLLWKRRQTLGENLPFVVYGLILSTVTACLLGYVVTNFGTLWRMRPLVAVPLWLIVIALSPKQAASPAPTRVAVAKPASVPAAT